MTLFYLNIEKIKLYDKLQSFPKSMLHQFGLLFFIFLNQSPQNLLPAFVKVILGNKRYGIIIFLIDRRHNNLKNIIIKRVRKRKVYADFIAAGPGRNSNHIEPRLLEDNVAIEEDHLAETLHPQEL